MDPGPDPDFSDQDPKFLPIRTQEKSPIRIRKKGPVDPKPCIWVKVKVYEHSRILLNASGANLIQL